MSMIWKDSQHRDWSCRFTIGDAKRLRVAGFDFADEQIFARIFGDSITQIEVVAELLKPKWESLGLKYEEFAELVCESEQQFNTVMECFTAGLVDFFPRIGKPWLAELVARTAEAARKGLEVQVELAQSDKIGELVNKSVAEAKAKAESEIERLLASSGN